MRSILASLLKDERGATAIEYGLIAALVSVAAIAALTALGGSLQTIFQFVATTLSSAASAGATPAPAPAPAP
jgi:pilus assembly protein Flp/PilA